MGGGFGSKFEPRREGLICAKLAQAGERAGQADARSQGRASRHRQPAVRDGAHPRGRVGRRHAHRVRRQSWGTGRRRRGRRASRCPTSTTSRTAGGRTRTSTSTPASSAPMRAPGHPQGCFLTEILMDELADRVKMDPVEFRIKNLPPDAPNAMWATYCASGAQAFGWDKRHPTGDPTPGPIKTGMGVSAHRGAAAAADSQAHCDITSDGGVVDASAARRTSAPARAPSSRWSRPKRSACRSAQMKPEIGDTKYPFSGGSGGSTTAASAISPAIRIAAGEGARCAVREGRAGARRRRPTTLVARGRPHLRQGHPVEGHCPGRTPASCIGTEPISVDGEWEAGLSSVTARAACSSPKSSVDIETGIVKVKRILAHPGLRPHRRQADRREPGATAASSGRSTSRCSRIGSSTATPARW